MFDLDQQGTDQTDFYFRSMLNEIQIANSGITKVFLVQKQPSRIARRKRCSEIMQEIYRRAPMTKGLQHGCAPVNLLHIFRMSFTNNTSGWLLLMDTIKTFQTCNQLALGFSNITFYFLRQWQQYSIRSSCTQRNLKTTVI